MVNKHGLCENSLIETGDTLQFLWGTDEHGVFTTLIKVTLAG